MRRRQREDPRAQIPARLREFDPADWMRVPVDGEPLERFEDADVLPLIEALRAWGRARQEWETRERWPTGTVNRLREQHETRRRVLGYPDLSQRRR